MSPPSWITSLGALVALATAAYGLVREGGVQAEGLRRTDEGTRRVEQRLDLLRDAQRMERLDAVASLRREIDFACACCRNH